MSDIQYPEALKSLPVARSIQEGEIVAEDNFVLIAHTGSGKTMVIPAVIALNGKKVVIRQPTRQTAKLTYLGLNKFWGDQLKIGFYTSEESVGTLDEYDIMVCTDGVMKNWLREPKYPLTVIFDEFHWQQPITEIELAIVKSYLNQGKNFNIVLLSATIRPSNVIKYFENLSSVPVSPEYIEAVCTEMDEKGTAINSMSQKQWLKLYYSEGVAYPIEDQLAYYVVDRKQSVDQTQDTITAFANRMLRENKRGLVFLCTRAEVQKTCNHIQEKMPDLPVEFAHADVKIEKIIDFVHDHEPSVLFATVSLATSATLPFDEVLIIDKGIDSVYENGIEKQVTDIPVDDNGVLQRRGRCGRVKPGVCTLATSHYEERPSWAVIRPTAITPPLEKVAPIQAALVCAQYEFDPRRLDTLSSLQERDLDRSIRRLIGMGVVIEDEDTLKLTSLGRKVASLPLEIELAVTVAKCDPDIMPAVIAIASCDPGVYSMFQIEVKTEDGKKRPGYTLLDPALVYPDSMLITKAKIVQAALIARDKENEETTLPNWSNANGLWPKRVERILMRFYQICTKGLRRSERNMRDQLKAMDIDAAGPRIIEYLFRLKTFDELEVHYDEYNNTPGYKGEFFNYFTTVDGLDIKILGLAQRGDDSLYVIGNTKMIKTKKTNFEMCILNDTTIIPPELVMARDRGV